MTMTWSFCDLDRGVGTLRDTLLPLPVLGRLFFPNIWFIGISSVACNEAKCRVPSMPSSHKAGLHFQAL